LNLQVLSSETLTAEYLLS